MMEKRVAKFKPKLLNSQNLLAIKIICDKNGVYVLFCSLFEHHI